MIYSLESGTEIDYLAWRRRGTCETLNRNTLATNEEAPQIRRIQAIFYSTMTFMIYNDCVNILMATLLQPLNCVTLPDTYLLVVCKFHCYQVIDFIRWKIAANRHMWSTNEVLCTYTAGANFMRQLSCFHIMLKNGNKITDWCNHPPHIGVLSGLRWKMKEVVF